MISWARVCGDGKVEDNHLGHADIGPKVIRKHGGRFWEGEEPSGISCTVYRHKKWLPLAKGVRSFILSRGFREIWRFWVLKHIKLLPIWVSGPLAFSIRALNVAWKTCQDYKVSFLGNCVTLKIWSWTSFLAQPSLWLQEMRVFYTLLSKPSGSHTVPWADSWLTWFY